MTTELVRRLYPAVADLLPAPGAGLPEPAVITVPAGTVLFESHTPCAGFPLVLDGEVTVSHLSEDGRALELYRVLPGQICLVSSASLFRRQPLAARGVATRATRLMLITPPLFQQWLAAPPFRDEVLGLFAQRMADLTSLIDAVAFQRLDQRLAGALLGHGQQWQITHQAIAEQLGTVREIVTRLLRRFEREGWVELSRERIRILDAPALRALSASDSAH